MDTALVAVTLVSLVLAATMTGVAMRLLREERRRSAARVAALTEELAGTPAADLPLRETHVAPAQVEPPRRPTAAHERRPAPAHVVETAPAAFGPASGTGDVMFGTATPSRGFPRRALVTIGIGALMAIGGTALLTSQGDEAPAAATVATAAGAPLELLSLRHSRQADTLTITGLVRNPDGAAPLKDVTAVAFLFDREGSFVASGRAPLDFRTLSSGDESPFVLTVPIAGPVGR